tara:strand:+ start:4483 stop:4743 length:261 start_codon:yes stop_codon:yes gene_type:complete
MAALPKVVKGAKAVVRAARVAPRLRASEILLHPAARVVVRTQLRGAAMGVAVRLAHAATVVLADRLPAVAQVAAAVVVPAAEHPAR